MSDSLTGDSTSCVGPLSQNDTCVLNTTYVVTSLDTPIDNTGTANSDQTGPVDDIESVLVPQPGLAIDKVYNGFALPDGDLDGSGDDAKGAASLHGLFANQSNRLFPDGRAHQNAYSVQDGHRPPSRSRRTRLRLTHPVSPQASPRLVGL